MKKSRKSRSEKGGERTAFEEIRKPVAPPGHPLSRAKPEQRAHPAERKVKHKRSPGERD